jgi:hypothetical protein
MMSDYKVEMVNDGMSEFYVEFHGPRDSTLYTPFISTFCYRGVHSVAVLRSFLVSSSV